VSRHFSDDDLALYYYGEGRRKAEIERHLDECASCAAVYREISGTLSMIVPDAIPGRGEQYGLEVWQRIRPLLPERESGFMGFMRVMRFMRFMRFQFRSVYGLAAAAAVLVMAAFMAGRSSVNPTNPANPVNPMNSMNPANPMNPVTPLNSDQRERILVGSVADHLDRSERVLTDIMNASDPRDISVEQRWAEDLLTTSRLYRQDAAEAGEQSIATVLDDLERSLLEIVHSPSKISAADLEQLRRRIDAAALLFKVRVMSDQLRDRETAPHDRPSPRASTSRIS
jgi:hypothetical protein